MTPSNGEPLRVLAVVHNRILREGICCLVNTQEELKLAGAASTAEDAVVRFEDLRPDLTLLDLDLPADGGLTAVRGIRELDPAAWIVALITDEADEKGHQALALGASTVIAKHRIGKVPWQKPARAAQASLKTGVSNTRSMGVLTAVSQH
jgi:DNA-binding NarL/FixJ family response regulator